MVIPCFSYRLWFGVIVKLIWNSVVLIVRIKHISLLEITLFLIYMSGKSSLGFVLSTLPFSGGHYVREKI